MTGNENVEKGEPSLSLSRFSLRRLDKHRERDRDRETETDLTERKQATRERGRAAPVASAPLRDEAKKKKRVSKCRCPSGDAEIVRVQANHCSSFLFVSFENSERCFPSLAAPPARDVIIQQHDAPGASFVERRGVDDSAAQGGGNDEEEVSADVIGVVAFGRRRRLFFFVVDVAILRCRSPLELRPARLFRTPCVYARPLSKRGTAKGKLARRGGELTRRKAATGEQQQTGDLTPRPTTTDAPFFSSSISLPFSSLPPHPSLPFHRSSRSWEPTEGRPHRTCPPFCSKRGLSTW